ncbi:MAG: hypothetical protein A2654_02210 [Candidatus Nealsonbacteria bacterium RIFCSPHIGHO2_01_FULL_43_31]|uniref:Uncharacterized protein n=1 Tax=Candidatus Nealsonbacteria bacterium RIFCSPHIGHO2_01_FULL_43_31 TaxID=1801665 RepID=A0A1G2E2E7_9BACT|nr:MAG: hypothetical protein A2654_02210 [Candidatus Nealsonbacteria bacterium RIFCSPHIGHO2_01_FULL_43_31]OGZ24971.1 MAG: hypothetical protein A2922_02580 [Candidatus Nealsonbacteria bacterium RIFCSPLOWO2_01_FULL_43_36]
MIISQIYKIIRRRLYYIFKKKYIIDSLAKRKGKCNHCSCCEIKFCGIENKCEYFDKNSKKCLVYNTEKMPTLCRIYPFDEKDKWDEFKDKCGFHWE